MKGFRYLILVALGTLGCVETKQGLASYQVDQLLSVGQTLASEQVAIGCGRAQLEASPGRTSNNRFITMVVLASAPWATIRDLESTLRDTKQSRRASGAAFGGI